MPQIQVHYKGEKESDVAIFKKTENYIVFKKQLTEEIHLIRDFYITHEINKAYKRSVERGLNSLIKKLFDEKEIDSILHVLFKGKQFIEKIVQALTPATGKPFSQATIEEKLIAIYNLAGEDPITGEVGCLVCASGTLRNLADAAQLLSTGNIFDSLQIQYKNICLEVIREYVLITHRSEIARRIGGHNHETNLLNTFINVFSKELGFVTVIESYVNENIVTAEDKENIHRILKFSITQDSIIDRLVAEYLKKIREHLIYDKEGMIDYPSAMDAIRKLEKEYGEHKVQDVFSFDDYQIIGITNDLTTIKTKMYHLFSQENKIRESTNKLPLTWPEDILISDNGDEGKLWQSGDLFWIELANEDGSKTIKHPSIQALGKEHINKIGYNQLLRILEQSNNPEDIPILFQLDFERLQAASKHQLTLFFSKLGSAQSDIPKIQGYITQNLEWFKISLVKMGHNPLFSIVLLYFSRDELAKLTPDDAVLQGLSAQQATDFLSVLASEDALHNATGFVTRYPEWFSAITKTSGKNPLMTLLLKYQTSEELEKLTPTNLALKGLSKQQANNFFSALAFEDQLKNALDFADQHQEWFSNLIEEIGENPLLTLLLKYCPPAALAEMTPEGTFYQRLSKQQVSDLLSAIAAQGHVNRAIAFITNNSIWFNNIINSNNENPIANIIIENLTSEELENIKPDLALKRLSIKQAEALFLKLTPYKAISYVEKHPAWFHSLVGKHSSNPLIPLLLEYLDSDQLGSIIYPDLVLSLITKQQSRDFFSALSSPDNHNVTSALEYASKSKQWFHSLVLRLGENPLLPLRLATLKRDQLAAMDTMDISLNGISKEQAIDFFAAMDDPESHQITSALEYANSHKEWFYDLVNKNGENPILSLLLTSKNSEKLTAIELELKLKLEISLYGPSKKQAINFFAAMDDPDSHQITNAMTYAQDHRLFLNYLWQRIGENSLIKLALERYTPQQLAKLAPDSIVFKGANFDQVRQFLSALDDPDSHQITNAMTYAQDHRLFFNYLLQQIGENSLIKLALERYTPQQLAKLAPDSIVLKGANLDQVEQFLSALDDPDRHEVNGVLAYVNKHRSWFSSETQKAKKSFILPIFLEHLTRDELTGLSPDSPALEGATQYQLRAFFSSMIDPVNHDVSKLRTYATQHDAWINFLVERYGSNPLFNSMINWYKTGDSLAELNPNTDIMLKGLSAEQATHFFRLLNNPRSGNITKALDFVNKNKPWYKALAKRIGKSPLASLLFSDLLVSEVVKYQPDIALDDISIEQAKVFFNIMRYGFSNPDPLSVLTYAVNNAQWFTDLVDRVGENILLPYLEKIEDPRELLQFSPDIILRGITAEQSIVFFQLLTRNNNLALAELYVKNYGDWFSKFVTKINHNPINDIYVRMMPGLLHELQPNNFAVWGMSVFQAEMFLACMDPDDSMDRAFKYVTDHPHWLTDLVMGYGRNPLVTTMLSRLSSKQLTSQSPKIVLDGLSDKQCKYFLSKMTPEDAAAYVKQHNEWFSERGWDIPALLARDEAHSFDKTPFFDIRPVNYWRKPEVVPRTDGGTMHYESQIIVQLENDPIVRDAVASLVGKHPDTSVIVQLDKDGFWQVPHRDLNKITGKVRWQVVGHSRVGNGTNDNQTMGIRYPEMLAKQLNWLHKILRIARSPEHISLVGCKLAYDNTKGRYIDHFAKSLTEQGMLHPTSISAYDTQLAVNEQGQKRLVEMGDKVILTKHGDQWVATQKAGKVDPAGTGRELLASLDKAKDYTSAMDKVYHENGLSGTDWLPILGSLKEDPTQPGTHSLIFIRDNKENIKTAIERKTVTISDPSIPDFIKNYDKLINSTKEQFMFADRQLIPRTNQLIEAEGEAVHSLNIAFIIQTWFTMRERNKLNNKDKNKITSLPKSLSDALRIHTYANYTQMGFSAAEDVVKIAQLWRGLAQNSIGGTAFKVIANGGMAIAIGLNLVSAILDSYELSLAQNEEQRAMFATQLTLDLANLTLCTVALGAGMLGAATLSAFLGPLGIPLAGLSVGITALVMNTQSHIQRTKLVGGFFDTLDKGYSQGGYQLKTKAPDGSKLLRWESSPYIAIKTIDLRLGHQMLTYADTFIYKTKIYGLGSGYANNITMGFPQSMKLVGGKSDVINIREGIDHPFKSVSFAIDLENNRHIPFTLPRTPQFYIDYLYDSFPGVTLRDDTGFKVPRRLEKNHRNPPDHFAFDFYTFPCEYAISDLKIEFITTPVQIFLDDATRTLIMPSLPSFADNPMLHNPRALPSYLNEPKGKMEYSLIGGSGTYHIILQEGESLSLQGGSEGTHWILDANSLKMPYTPSFNSHGKLQIGGMAITLTDDFKGKLDLVSQEGTFLIDVKDRQNPLITQIDVDAHRFKNRQLLHEHLKQLSQTTFSHQPFVIVEDFVNPQGERVGRAFYETAKDRIIYTDSPDQAEFLSGAEAPITNGDTAWFYRDSYVWQVNIADGKLLQEYRTVDFEDSLLQYPHLGDRPLDFKGSGTPVKVSSFLMVIRGSTLLSNIRRARNRSVISGI